MCDFDYEAMGNTIALKLMLKGVREPTLWEVQQDPNKDFKSTPAWLANSQLHPGLPEHYIALCSIENDESSTVDEDDVPLPKLPFDVHREISQKLLIAPTRRPNLDKLPKLISLMNGTVVIVGPPLPEPSATEIFLVHRKNLIPCCYAKRSQIIANGPASTATGRARCYYIPSSTLQQEISFSSSTGKLLYHSPHYRVKCFHGSTPYQMLHVNL